MDMDLVLRFYNERRKQLLKAEPNAAHLGLAELEKSFHVEIITQNVDNLHERAGSNKILHLHGELTKVRSTVDPSLIYELDGWELKRGDTCEKGSQLRPHIVWFGESVPAIETAIEIVQKADLLVIIGTSMVVYPAAGLINYVPSSCPIFVIDPNDVQTPSYKNIEFIQEKASVGIKILQKKLMAYLN
jgi:NAD-dependent deacetylase